MTSKILRLLAAVVLAFPLTLRAGVILQNQFTTNMQINFFEPIGQSFVAEDSAISFAFHYAPINPSFPNDPLQLQLLSGDGLGGSVLASVTFSLPSGFDGFYDVDFSSISLIVGNSYTAVLTIPGASPHWGTYVNQAGDLYTSGRAYFTSFPFLENQPNDDMQFRVTPTIVGVPEPATLALLLLGLVGFALSRRKQ